MNLLQRYILLLVLVLLPLQTIALDKPVLSVINFSGILRSNEPDPLSRTLSDFLVTDLSRIKNLTLVDRESSQAVIREMELAITGLVDEKNSPRLGQLLGASHLLTGKFLRQGNRYIVNYRLIDVETGTVAGSGTVEGTGSAFRKLVSVISRSVADDLKKIFPAIEVPQENKEDSSAIDLSFAESYGRAVLLEENGKYAKANEILRELLKKNPSISELKLALDSLQKRIDEYDSTREKLISDESRENTYNAFIKTTTALSSGMQYTRLLAYCRGIKKNPPPAPDGSIISTEEMADYYIVICLQGLKNNDDFIPEAESFLRRYPGSIYYRAVKMYLAGAVDSIRDRDKNMKAAEKAIAEIRKTREGTPSLKNYLSALEYMNYRLFGEALPMLKSIDLSEIEKDKIKPDLVLYQVFQCYYNLAMKQDGIKIYTSMALFYPESPYLEAVRSIMEFFPE